MRKTLVQNIVRDAKIFSIVLFVASFVVSLAAHLFAPYVEGDLTLLASVLSVFILVPNFTVILLSLVAAWYISAKQKRLSLPAIFFYLTALVFMAHEFVHHLAYILYYSPMLQHA